jgi:hypothetical protein
MRHNLGREGSVVSVGGGRTKAVRDWAAAREVYERVQTSILTSFKSRMALNIDIFSSSALGIRCYMSRNVRVGGAQDAIYPSPWFSWKQKANLRGNQRL